MPKMPKKSKKSKKSNTPNKRHQRNQRHHRLGTSDLKDAQFQIHKDGLKVPLKATPIMTAAAETTFDSLGRPVPQNMTSTSCGIGRRPSVVDSVVDSND